MTRIIVFVASFPNCSELKRVILGQTAGLRQPNTPHYRLGAPIRHVLF
jgi:hypothetical protein